MRDRQESVPRVGTDAEVGRLHNLRHRLGLVGRTALAAICIQAGGMAGVAVADQVVPAQITAGPFEGEITMNPLQMFGGTTIETSVGDLKYPDTHSGAAIDVRAQVKNTVTPRQFFGRTSVMVPNELDRTGEQLKSNIPRAAKQTIAHTTTGFMLGGLAGGIGYLGLMSSAESLLGKDRQKASRKLGALCFVSVAGMGLVPFTAQPILTRNADFSQNMQATGLLAHGKQYADNYDKYVDQLNDPSKEFFSLNSLIEGSSSDEEPSPQPDICLLVVSDAHGGGYRPGTELGMRDKDKSCHKITLNAGDFTDWGKQFESQRPAVQDLPDLPGVKLAVKGNHDSQNIMDYIDRLPNVTVLNSKVYRADGLSVLGIGDPTFTPDNPDHKPITPPNYALGKEIASHYNSSNMPDIVMTHEPAALKGFLDNLPKGSKLPILAVAGHTHKLQISSRFDNKNIIYVNPGTVSGGGLRLINPDTNRQTPLSAVTVYLTRSGDNYVVQKATSLSEDYQGDDESLAVRTFQK